jgi:poly(A) polymerase
MIGVVGRLLGDRDVASLLAALAAAGEEARIVGGAVRDAVMGREPGDIDIATSMLPRDVMDLAAANRWKAVPTGIEHGTVTIVIAGTPYEVTTLRRDVETDGRRAVVAFTRDFREDAFRRDFTINALSLSADGAIHDYATGRQDAAAGIIRFMGDPDLRIREDYLRILRFFRFHASHGRGAPESDGAAACAALKGGMSRLSRERVRRELLKLIAAPGAGDAAEAMRAIDLWPEILPQIGVDIPAFRRWAALRTLLPSAQDEIPGLAALTPGAATADLVRSLTLSRAEEALLRRIRENAPLLVRAVRRHDLLREAVHRVGPDDFAQAMLAAAAAEGLAAQDVLATVEAARPILARPPAPPFRSADVAALGVPAGPAMGQALRRAEALWIAAGLPEDQAQCDDILRSAVRAAAD